LFSEKLVNELRENILNGNIKQQLPHVYMIAGKAYHSMLYNETKQAIVISGESGAGKT
jgi:myosin heavy subunit